MVDVENPSLVALASVVESSSFELRDRVVLFCVGADDFLAGRTLDSMLVHLVHLLERLAELPSMAVVGSMPNLVPSLAIAEIDGPLDSLSATLSVWNEAIAAVASEFSAEFVDLSAVPAVLEDGPGVSRSSSTSVRPEFATLTHVLTLAIGRAAERVRSFQTDS